MYDSRLKKNLKKIYPIIYFVNSLQSKTKIRKPSKLTIFSIFIGIYLSFVSFYIYVLKDLPSPSTLSTQSIPQTTHIKDRNGVELYKIYRSQNRTLVTLKQLPDHIIHSIIAIEDKNFYNHKGFSLSGIVRAIINNLKKGNIQGGSTITQQLVKTSLLTSERTIQRKLKELVLSIAVESMYSKDQILEMYINRVGFGGATYGIEEAAQTYFRKKASDLTLSESSLLAGLPASPTTYSPFGSHPELAKKRQVEVLDQMVSSGYITFDQAQKAAEVDLIFSRPIQDIKAPHFVMYVKEILANKYGHETLEQGGLDVTTTLDLDIQTKVQEIITSELQKISHLKVSNGAGLITMPQTGQILAMVGSKNYFDLQNDGNVNVTLSLRQPGSSIKPINYALALSNGYTAASIIEDSPITYRISGSEPYSPVNYDNRYHGPVSLRTALGSSYNIPAVKLLAANGVSKMIDLGQKMGITTWEDRNRFGLSLTLGGGEIKMTELATAYGVFANSGIKIDLNPILEVRDSKGKILESNKTGIKLKPNPVIDPSIAFLINDILSDNAARTPTFGSKSQLYIPKSKVAVKTGTTNSLRDNWTIGYTPDFLVAIWVGNNNNSPMSYIASGVTGASPIWRKITDYLLTKFPFTEFSPPTDIIKLNICPSSGLLSCFSCSGKFEYFIPGTEPLNHCSDAPKPTPTNDRILDGRWTIRL